MKNNNVIFKMSKYNLRVTYFLAVSLSKEPLEPLSIEIGLSILEILKEKQKTLKSVSMLVNAIKVIVGIHYTYPQN